jgi:hypothetical protein
MEEVDLWIPVSPQLPSTCIFSLCVPARAACGGRYEQDADIRDPKAEGAESPKTNSTLKPAFGDVTENKEINDTLDQVVEDETFASDEDVARHVLNRVYEKAAFSLDDVAGTVYDENTEAVIVEHVTPEESDETIVREILNELYESIEASQTLEASNDESTLANASENPTQTEVI